MSGLTELAQVIHEEHFRSLVLICGLESRVSGDEAARPIDPTFADDRALLDQLICGLDEMKGHNALEESALFPLLKDQGEGELTELLVHEHAALAPITRRLRSIAVRILSEVSSEDAWTEFCAVTRELVAELMFHLQKEENVIVQKLGSLLDPRVDHALALRFRSHAAGSHGADDENAADDKAA